MAVGSLWVAGQVAGFGAGAGVGELHTDQRLENRTERLHRVRPAADLGWLRERGRPRRRGDGAPGSASFSTQRGFEGERYCAEPEGP